MTSPRHFSPRLKLLVASGDDRTDFGEKANTMCHIDALNALLNPLEEQADTLDRRQARINYDRTLVEVGLGAATRSGDRREALSCIAQLCQFEIEQIDLDDEYTALRAEACRVISEFEQGLVPGGIDVVIIEIDGFGDPEAFDLLGALSGMPPVFGDAFGFDFVSSAGFPVPSLVGAAPFSG